VEVRKFNDASLEKFQLDPTYNYDDDPRLASNPVSAWWKNIWRKIDQFMKEATSPMFWKIIRFLIIMGVILLLVYHLGNSHRSGILSRKDDLLVEAKVRVGADNYQKSDIKNIIQELEAKGEFRLAIRWIFIQFLKDLSDRNLIKWSSKTSNKEIVRSIQNPENKKEFEQLLRLYEYIWYGAHQLNNPEQYQRIKKRFDNFIQAKKSRV
jgi:hypothetical protein